MTKTSAMGVVTVDQRDAMRCMSLQIRVTGKARARVCVWVAVYLFRLASIVLGPKASIDIAVTSA